MDLKTLHHELRTPLTGILGLAELMKQEALSSEQRSDVEAIYACGERLLKFCEVLLSKIQQETEISETQNLKYRNANRFFCLAPK